MWLVNDQNKKAGWYCNFGFFGIGKKTTDTNTKKLLFMAKILVLDNI